MQWPLFIARRMARGDRGSFSRFIISIATAAVALSVAVMIVASSLFTGFDNTIKDKLFTFWGHIHIVSMAQNEVLGDSTINIHQPFYPGSGIPGISKIVVYASKAGIISTRTSLEGIVLKGYDHDLDTSILHPFIEEGRCVKTYNPIDPREILISRVTANRLLVHVNDTVTVFFINANSRTARRLRIAGIYSTGLQEYDKEFAITDIRLIRRLNGWDSAQVAGFEVHLSNADDIAPVTTSLNSQLPTELKAITLKDIYPNIFEWLRLNATNEFIVITLMAVVAIVNMITALLILIIERTRFIGIMKALGSSERKIRQVFLWNALWIISRGILWGNLIGIGLCLLQKYVHVIRLNPETYYVAYAPVSFNIPFIIIINIGTLITCTLALFLPVLLVRRITPVKAVRWE